MVEKFNDTLALIMIIGVPLVWLASHWIPLSGEVIGATIAGWTLVIQFYFRRYPPTDTLPPPEE